MTTIHGPYKRNSDGRWIIIVDGVTISYPKYLYEQHHKIKVEEPMTVDHKDENPDNNSIDNLQLKSRKQNAQDGSMTGRTFVLLTCGFCKKEFRREKRLAPRKAHWKAYCSLDCRNLSL